MGHDRHGQTPPPRARHRTRPGGALIGELVLHQRIAVRGVRLDVIDSEDVMDKVTNRVLADIGDSPHHTDVRTWLAYLAQRSVDDVGARL
ncbi:GPP34 family phosphoprotein [Nonomuraea sp. NPDC004186]